MVTNKSLNDAQRNKYDEYYTMLPDIEYQLNKVSYLFEGKIIYCPCDDPRESHFYTYFKENFLKFKLKRAYFSFLPLIEDDKPFLTTITLDEQNNLIEEKQELESGSMFDNKDIYLKSDIVVTNPPFSLFANFMIMLKELNKDFILIGNQNVYSKLGLCDDFLNYKIKVWFSKSMHFRVPDDYIPIKEDTIKIRNGVRCVKIGVAKWFSTFPPPEDYSIYSKIKNNKFEDREYKKFHNCDAIEVSSVYEIPFDYEGLMAVPCNYLTRHDPKYFKMVGSSQKNYYNKIANYENAYTHYPSGKVERGTHGYHFMYQSDKPIEGKSYITCDNHDGYFIPVYKRILIQRRLD